MHTKKTMTLTQAMQELHATQHEISSEQAAEMVKNYKTFRSKMMKDKKTGSVPRSGIPALPICLTFQRDAVLNLMKAPGCAGIRMYFAINRGRQLSLVLVGVDETGE